MSLRDTKQKQEQQQANDDAPQASTPATRTKKQIADAVLDAIDSFGEPVGVDMVFPLAGLSRSGATQVIDELVREKRLTVSGTKNKRTYEVAAPAAMTDEPPADPLAAMSKKQVGDLLDRIVAEARSSPGVFDVTKLAADLFIDGTTIAYAVDQLRRERRITTDLHGRLTVVADPAAKLEDHVADWIVTCSRTRPGPTAAAIADALRLDEKLVQRVLAALVKAERVTVEGTGKAAFYEADAKTAAPAATKSRVVIEDEDRDLYCDISEADLDVRSRKIPVLVGEIYAKKAQIKELAAVQKGELRKLETELALTTAVINAKREIRVVSCRREVTPDLELVYRRDTGEIVSQRKIKQASLFDELPGTKGPEEAPALEKPPSKRKGKSKSAAAPF